MKALWLIAIAAIAWLWWMLTPPPAPVEQYRQATPSSAVLGVPKETIQPPKVRVYAEPAKRKLDLPQPIADDAAKHVLDASTVKADDHPQTIVTVIDDQTGEVQTYVRRDPLPWLAAEQRGELRFDVGVKNGLAKVGRLAVREDLLQVKSLHVGLNASIDTDGSWFAGAGVGWKW